MKSLFLIWPVFAVGIIVTALYSCDDGGENKRDNFDRSKMLQNYADNLIIPAYSNLQNAISELQTSAITFTDNPAVNSLADLQLTWEAAYASWQYGNSYNFGPAAEEGLQKSLIEEIGIFPASTSKIENAISTGIYNLNDFNRDARGLVAIEYLIFNLNDDNATVVNSFQSQNRKKYLIDLIANIKSRTDAVAAAWNGGYRNEFINNDGTDAGSSTSHLYNEFVRSYEFIKTFKIGLPLGKLSGQTQPEPTKVEAYYSGKSIKMFKTHFKSIEDIWYGRKTDGTDGIGFKEYLESVEGGSALVAATEAQLASINIALNAVSETPRFSDQLLTSPLPIDALHIELQKNTRYFKSDMSSLLGIAITFSSGDGD